MKFKEILLDFTPLLDVIMIILFWFILNYHNQTVEIQEQAKSTMAEAESISAEAEDKKAEADELYEELLGKQDEIDKLLSEIAEADERKAANIEGLNEFQKGLNLTAQLYRCDDGNFMLKIFKGNEINDDSVCEEINIDDFSTQKFKDIIESYEYTPEDAVLFELIYNNEESGSYRVIRYIEEVIAESKETYKYLYSRKLKIGEEEVGK